MDIKVTTVARQDRARLSSAIAALEANATYPLGGDRFRIDHGDDYFAFFDRLGEVRFEVALHGDRVVACAAAILRFLPSTNRNGTTPCWYLCDLKVDPQYRGQRIPFRIFKRAFAREYVRCPRVYGISMDSPDHKENRIARLARRFRFVPVRTAGTLCLYSLNEAQMLDLEPLLAKERGALSYLSLVNIKDIILQSNGRPMKLMHVQSGPCAQRAEPRPRAGHKHMFCAMQNDPLVPALTRHGIAIHATATVIEHRMRDFDWRFILTSDI